MDLDEIRDFLEPVSHTEEKYICCLCCQSGPIRLSITLQKRAHNVGEQIVFSVEVDNKETDELLRKVEAKLKEFFTFISKSGNTRSVFTQDNSSVRVAEGVAPRSEQSWRDITLDIPTHTIPTFDNCECIHLSYIFSVKIKMSSAFNLKVWIQVTISSNPQMTPNHSDQPPFSLGNVMPTEARVMLPLSANCLSSSMTRSTESGIVDYPPRGHSQPVITQQPTLPVQNYHARVENAQEKY